MRALRTVARVTAALSILIGVPLIASGKAGELISGRADAVSSATQTAEQPSGEYVVLINRGLRSDPNALEAWKAFFSVSDSDGIVLLFEDISCTVSSSDPAGLAAGGSRVMTILAWLMAALIVLHTMIGVKLTADTLSAIKKSGAGYFRENKLFWTRRISGAAVMLFIISHIILFMGERDGGVFRLSLFDGSALIGQLLLVLSAAVHIITNIKPLMISLGKKNGRELAIDILFVLSAILLLSGAAFIVYYIHWRTY